MILRTSVFTFTPAATSFSTRLHDDTVKRRAKNSHGGEVYLFSDSTGVSDTTRRSLRAICSWRS